MACPSHLIPLHLWEGLACPAHCGTVENIRGCATGPYPWSYTGTTTGCLKEVYSRRARKGFCEAAFQGVQVYISEKYIRPPLNPWSPKKRAPVRRSRPLPRVKGRGPERLGSPMLRGCKHRDFPGENLIILKIQQQLTVVIKAVTRSTLSNARNPLCAPPNPNTDPNAGALNKYEQHSLIQLYHKNAPVITSFVHNYPKNPMMIQ